MSTEQKVRRLRAEGYSYRTIADKIGQHWYGFELSFPGKAPPEWKRYGTRTHKVSDGMTSARNVVDPGNVILNYAYAVVLGNLTRALIGLGLDPAFGFLHADKPGRLSVL